MPRLIVMTAILAVLGSMPSVARAQVDEGEARIAEEAFVYGFPMVMNYAVFYQYFVDKSDASYKAPLNQIYNEANVFTYKDTAIVTPNSDTPYSFIGMDLRAEPYVICNPEIDKLYDTSPCSSSICTRSTTGMPEAPRHGQRCRMAS